MFRLAASLLIVLITASGVFAHAGSGDVASEMAHVDHATAQSMKSHSHGDSAAHDGHASACMLGHCALFCGVLLPGFSMSVSFTLVDAGYEHSAHRLPSTVAGSDPPPPKL